MQTTVHSKMDATSSHGYRSGEGRGPNPNSYPKSYDNNESSGESPYSGWQSLNSMGSSSSANSWSIPDKDNSSNKAGVGRKEENMSVDGGDGGSSFSGLLGATGGSDDSSFSSNSSRPMHAPPPRLGLLGGGEGATNWNGGNQSVGAWGSNDASNSENMLVDGEMNLSNILNAPDCKQQQQSNGNSYGSLPRMGLLGGGEGTTATSGWVGSSSNSSAPTWGSNPRTSTSNDLPGSGTTGKAQGSWAQAAGKGLPPTGMQGPPPPIAAPDDTAPNSSSTLRDRAELEAKEFQLKAAFSEGWGQNSVNQDSPWDVPTTPPPENGKEVAPSAVWRAPVNMGTEIWENNLRMGKGSSSGGGGATSSSVGGTGQGSSSAPPWGHTPSTNIGGHWGDDDASNMWSGVPPGGHWGAPEPPASNMWGSPMPGCEKQQQQQHWGGSQSSSSWGDGACNSEGSSSVWTPSNNKSRPISNWSPMATPKKEMPPPPSGWEPPSPPPNRRGPVGGGYDDGTSVWGNPQRQGKVSHWKDMPPAKPIVNAVVGPPPPGSGMMGMPPSGPGMIRLPGSKDSWNSGNRPPNGGRGSGSWQDMPPPPHRDSPSIGSWGEEQQQQQQHSKQQNSMMQQPYAVGSWGDQSNTTSLQYWGAKPKANCNWADGQVDTSSWLGPSKQGGKPLCKDIVHASKQFRILTELGFRKEDVENALRNNNMNIDDAAAELQALNSGGGSVMDVDGFGGRKVRPANLYEDMSDPSAESNFHGTPNFQGNLNFPTAASHSFKQQSKNNVQAFGNMKFPTNSHLRHLVQQIQMAVQAGHLNAQILNQPLAPQTLQFLYQLLQQIKVLTQLQQQSSSSAGKHPQQPSLQLSVQIAQTKQRINNLQNQICANQALYLKQIPQQPPHPASGDLFKAGLNEASNIHTEFRELFIKDSMPHHSHHHSHPQSRLNQWKLSADKEEPQDLIPDFSRAPGSLHSSKVINNSALHPLLGEQGDSAWSGRSSHGESGWPEVVSSSSDNSSGGVPPLEGKEGTGNSSYNLTDLVPEFEPGKPWKGTSQLKNIEDDPHITPGSIARSPLSVNNIKESNLFWPPKTTTADAAASSSSSTWVFNPSSSTSGPNASSAAVKSSSGKSGWGSDFGTAGELWGSVAKSRNAPPGISNQGWDRPQNSTFLILRNLTPQIDGSTLKTLCMQHGPLQMFHLFQNGGVALVRYSTREEALKAQCALNNCVLGNTTMLADIPSDTEIQQYLLQVSSGQQTNSGGGGSAVWPSSAQNGSFHGTTVPSSSTFYGSSNTTNSSSGNWTGNQLWSFSGAGLWGSSQPSGDGHDTTANPIHSYLPGDLLGTEPM